MITKAQITRRASREGVTAKTVERDYVLARIVAAVANLGKSSRLVFKGGTALRLCHIEDYRYSADLDFSVVGCTRKDAYRDIEKALLGAGGSIQELRLSADRQPAVMYLGPLGRERRLKLDIADDELVINTERRSLLPRWPDLPASVQIHVYTLLEIAGEKLRCVLQRLQCRDLFDLNLLFEQPGLEVAEAVEVFKAKAQHRKFDPGLFATRYPERLEQYRKRWNSELAEHIPGAVPHFDEIERTVSRHLRRGGLL